MRDVVALAVTIILAIVVAQLIAARVQPGPVRAYPQQPIEANPQPVEAYPITILDYIRMRYPNAVV